MTIFFDTSAKRSVPLEFIPDQSMYRPGELMKATINGLDTVVYLTMDEVSLNDEGEPMPRFRTYPGHEMVPPGPVSISGPIERFVPIALGLMKK